MGLTRHSVDLCCLGALPTHYHLGRVLMEVILFEETLLICDYFRKLCGAVNVLNPNHKPLCYYHSLAADVALTREQPF